MKSTTKSSNLTSFYGSTFKATVKQLTELLGEPAYDENDGQEKVNYKWVMETEDGDVFRIYDWKYYRPIRLDEDVYWHIGGHGKSITEVALKELTKVLI